MLTHFSPSQTEYPSLTTEQLRAAFVEAPGEHQALFSAVSERWAREPLQTFVYAVRL